jgi:hypothetical protein
MQSKMWSRLLKSILGCAIGAILASVLVLLSPNLWQLIINWPETHGISDFLSLNVIVTSLASLFILAVLTIIGLPIQLLLQKHGFTGYVIHGILGSSTGALVPLIGGEIQPFLILQCAALGLISVSVAWLIRRPDLDNITQNQPPKPL